MNNYSFPNINMPQQFGQIQQMFPQPQGSVYSIQTPLDIGNVPTGSTGLSVALCLNEGLMYIKSLQNGAPVVMAYKVEPFSSQKPVLSNEIQPDINNLSERIKKIENQLSKLPLSGGKFDELL